MFTIPTEEQTDAAVTPIDPPARRTFFRVAMTIVALEPLLIFIILMVAGVPWWMIACIFAAGLIIVAGVFWVIALVLWKPWQRRYPAQPILPGAVSQSWQSFGFGRFGRMNNCVTIIADQRHLHLTPFAPLRWVGARTLSLPLDRISELRPGILPRTSMVANIDGHAISRPQWCLSLAQSEEQG